jgi:hypothetical protein
LTLNHHAMNRGSVYDLNMLSGTAGNLLTLSIYFTFIDLRFSSLVAVEDVANYQVSLV